MTDAKAKNEMLEPYFAAMREQAPEPSDALLQRVLADAEIMQASTQAAMQIPSKHSVWRRIFADLGGWPALTGLGTAALTGIWLGVSPPMVLSNTAQAVFDVESDAVYLADLSPEAALGFDEGGL